MGWGERGGDGRERVRDGGRYGLDRETEMGGKESQRYRKICVGERGGEMGERDSEI